MKYFTKLIIKIFFVAIPIYLFSSCNDAGILPVDNNTKWIKSYGGVNSDVLSFMDLTGDGGSIITGYTISTSFGDNDIYAMKLDKTGNIVWSNSFGSSGNDQANCITQTGDGNYIIVGQTNSFGASGFDIYVLKINSGGNIIWSNIYKAPNDDYATGVIESSEGGYIVSGYSNSFGSANNADAFIMKLSVDGNVQWAKSFGQIDNDYATCIKKTGIGYIIGGYSYSFSQTSDMFVANFNSNGTLIWSRMYGGYGDDRAISINTSGNDILVAGYTSSFGLSSEDMFILKLDDNGFSYNGPNGTPRTFGDSALLNDRANSIIPTTDGGYLISGFVSTSANTKQLAVLKLFGNMEYDWAKMYTSTSNDAGNNIRRSQNHYIVAGTTYAQGNGDIYTLAIKDDGSSCGNTVNFTPLGGKPVIIEGPVTFTINDVTSVFQKTGVQSQSGSTGFSSVTTCNTQ